MFTFNFDFHTERAIASAGRLITFDGAFGQFVICVMRSPMMTTLSDRLCD